MSSSIIFSDRVSAGFAEKVTTVADRLDVDRDWLMAVIAFETANTFSASVQNPHSDAVGLIQFMPRTAAALLGLNPNDPEHREKAIRRFKDMSATEQLDYVREYFWPYASRLDSLEDTYMAVLWPRAVGKPMGYVLFSGPDGLAYRWNNGLDRNEDGAVTKWEATALVRDIYERGLSQQDLPQAIQGLMPMHPRDLMTTFDMEDVVRTGTIEAHKILARNPKNPKPKRKSKTVWGLAAFALGVIGMAVGLGPEWAAFIADGLQWADLFPAAAAAGTVLTGYGLRTAKQPLE